MEENREKKCSHSIKRIEGDYFEEMFCTFFSAAAQIMLMVLISEQQQVSSSPIHFLFVGFFLLNNKMWV